MLPQPLRRMVFSPLWLALAVICSLLSPLLLVVALLASAITRRRQPLLMLRFGLIYLLREAGVILACGALWVASGFGARLRSERFQLAHYDLMRWLLGGIIREGTNALHIGVDHEPTRAAEQALRTHDGPLLVFSRHAGPGDSVLIIHTLLARYGRLPRVVFKRALAIDPCVDLLSHRLPNALVDPSDHPACMRAIGELAGGMDRRGALVLFPEGGNFTPSRRRRAIDRLRREGRDDAARQAEQMRHVIAPNPGGALAALEANPRAAVIFAAHTGLGNKVFARELWQELPAGRTMHMRMWLAPTADRPPSSDRSAQVQWLFDWWLRMDDWIEAQGTEPIVPELAPAAAPEDPGLARAGRG